MFRNLAFMTLLMGAIFMGFYFRTEQTADLKKSGDKPNLKNEKALERLKQDGSYASLMEAVTAAQYKIEQNGATLSAENPAQKITARFDENGNLQIFGSAQDWQTVFKLKSFGRGEEQTTVGGGNWQFNENRAELRRARLGLTEYFENRSDGLEQGFILSEKPAGAENLRLILQTNGELSAAASADGQMVVLSDESGTEALRYDKLKVWDAENNNLTARMTTDETGEIRLEVEDRERRLSFDD